MCVGDGGRGGGGKEEKGRERKRKVKGSGKLLFQSGHAEARMFQPGHFHYLPCLCFPSNDACACQLKTEGSLFWGCWFFSPSSLFFSSLSVSCSQFLWRIDLKSPGEFPV